MSQHNELPTEFVTRDEWDYLYRGAQEYAELDRASVWVTFADVFDDGLAQTLIPLANYGIDTPLELISPVRDLTGSELSVARQFFTLVTDMPPKYNRQMRWVFGYSSQDSNFLTAVRHFPLLFESIGRNTQLASRMWMDGEYMSSVMSLTEGLPLEYARAVYPDTPPTLIYPY